MIDEMKDMDHPSLLMEILATLPIYPRRASVTDLSRDFMHSQKAVCRLITDLRLMGYPIGFDRESRTAWLHADGNSQALRDAENYFACR